MSKNTFPSVLLPLCVILSCYGPAVTQGQTSPPACGNADLRVSQSRTSLVMSWVCDQRSNTDITDPQVANISVLVIDNTREQNISLSNSNFTIIGPMSIDIRGRYGQPVTGDDFTYWITMTTNNSDQSVNFSGRFSLNVRNEGMKGTQPNTVLVIVFHLVTTLSIAKLAQ